MANNTSPAIDNTSQSMTPKRDACLNKLRAVALALITYSFCAAIVLGQLKPAQAVPHSTPMLPQNAEQHCPPEAPCTQPTVDGQVIPLEYADGLQFPLQDYDHGGPNGSLYLMVADIPGYSAGECNVEDVDVHPSLPAVQDSCRSQTLFIGMVIPAPQTSSGEPINAAGILTLWLDALRLDTINNIAGATNPRTEDRRLTLRYNMNPGGSTLLQQHRGNGSGWEALSLLASTAWPVKYKLKQYEGKLHIEFAIGLRSARSIAISEPLQSDKLGFSLRHKPSIAGSTGLIGGGFFRNDKNSPPQDLLTTSWETLDFKDLKSIPLSLATWNIGQMPDIVPKSDGGSGEPDTIAQQIYKRDLICLQEVWSEGDQEELLENVNSLRKNDGLPRIHAVSDAIDEIAPDGTTGLMILSSRPIILSGVHHFPSDLCDLMFEDCQQEKGVLWARIATPAAAPKPAAPVTPSPKGWDAGEFVDVFCTHVQAGDNGPGESTTVRQKQFGQIASYIGYVRQGGPIPADFAELRDRSPEGSWTKGIDRPAFLMGDFNTHGPKGSENPASFDEYLVLLDKIGLSQPTEFELTNSLFSDRHDLAMALNGPEPAASGTFLSSNCRPTVGNELTSKYKHRLDYIFALPPEDQQGQLPAYAIKKEPKASVDPHYDPSSGTSEGDHQCLSDHAEVTVSLDLAKTADSIKYNPTKPHHVVFTIDTVEDLETASGCCADFYSNRMYLYVNGGSEEKAYPLIQEGDPSVSPNWAVTKNMLANFQGGAYMTGEVDEADYSPAPGDDDDHYDTIPEFDITHPGSDSLDAHFKLWAPTGQAWRVKGESSDAAWNSVLEYLGSFQDGFADGMICITEGPQNAEGSLNSARIVSRIKLVEMD